ncbi:uncharacterized protein LOC112571945 isoform X2 [Pomacea canaliculata]|uniref:uncharacterized protein LOC112571945 isoform X2 n=1 Tax=Pomacea canaliculata TaxID=400727 RepID=UPI000D72C2B6|nr:uncharacterized protein LOC112571945 isoform X2 [Pomacea canaliculata]
MWLQSSPWSKAVNSSLLCLVSMATLQSSIVGVNGVFVFNVSDLTHRTLPAFEQNFLKITNYALQKENTAYLFTRIALSSAGVGKEKGVGGIERFKDMLKGLVSAVDERNSTIPVTFPRYSGVLQALQGLKREFEKNIHNATDHSPPRLQYKCCDGPPPIYRYQGRYREEVNISRECWGQTPETASQVFRLRADGAFHLMKKNYENNTALLWQYVASLDGHFVQFPSKNRHCDHNGNSVSPLTMRWMMEKVLQQRLNLVLLLDAGNHMLHTAVSSSDQAPVQHWLMAKEAAKRVVNELVAMDRVSVIVLTNQSVFTPPGCR